MRPYPSNGISNRPQTLGYFPTPTPSHVSNPADGYDPYEATLLPSRYLEHQPPQRNMAREDSQLTSNANALFRHDPASQFREPHGAWQTATPPLHAGQIKIYPMGHRWSLIVCRASCQELAEYPVHREQLPKSGELKPNSKSKGPQAAKSTSLQQLAAILRSVSARSMYSGNPG
jgi:hypothetical protein